MNIVYLGSLCSPKLYAECISKSISLDNAGLVLQNSLLEGLNANANIISTFSLPSILSKKKILIKEEKYITNYCKNNYSIQYINISGIKQILSLLFSYNCKQKIQLNPDVIFIYSIESPLLKIAKHIKNKYPKCKIIMFITDLPEFMSNSKNKLYRTLKSVEAKIVNKYINIIDGYILLSKYMPERFSIGSKPYMIMEGIWNGNNERNEKKSYDTQYKTILYTGGLTYRYGIANLIDAFMSLSNNNYRLLLCGKGDCEEYIMAAAKKDKRIHFLGQLAHKKIIELQQQADLLVNPRNSDEIYTRYSFPSKIMEYLASGTPTLLCKLPAIPEEYYKYCFTVENTEIETLRCKIDDIFHLPDEKLKSIACAAQRFINQNKNAKTQGEKIVNFINTIKFNT